MLPRRWEKLPTLSRVSCSKHTVLVLIDYSLIFPRWDVIVTILSMFLMTYTYIEAKSNYHRGSILILRHVEEL